jgi:hypothetical protein
LACSSAGGSADCAGAEERNFYDLGNGSRDAAEAGRRVGKATDEWSESGYFGRAILDSVDAVFLGDCGIGHGDLGVCHGGITDVGDL